MTVFGGDDLLVGQLNAVIDRPRATVLFGAPSIANGSVQTLTPSSAPVNVGGMWTSGSSITIPSSQSGEYDLGIVLRYASQAVAAGIRQCRIQVDGGEYMSFHIPTTTLLNATNIIVSLTIPAILNAGQVVSFAAFQSSGGALSLVSGYGWVRKVP